MCINPSHNNNADWHSYREDDNDADIFGIFPELVTENHLGIVNDSNGEDEQTEYLHQHGGLKNNITQHMTILLIIIYLLGLHSS